MPQECLRKCVDYDMFVHSSSMDTLQHRPSQIFASQLSIVYQTLFLSLSKHALLLSHTVLHAYCMCPNVDSGAPANTRAHSSAIAISLHWLNSRNKSDLVRRNINRLLSSEHLAH
eukprot:1160032-Pelagomonas_calceolata.AAC.6